jgi:hypothetical protein
MREKTKEQKNKRNAYMREYRHSHPEYQQKRSEKQRDPEYRKRWIKLYSKKRKDRRAEMRKFVFEIKKTLSCEICG